MIEQDEQKIYEPYAYPYYEKPYSSVGVPDTPPAVPVPEVQSVSQPPKVPLDSRTTSSAPSKWRRVGTILLLTLLLMLVLSVGLFAGWQFASTKSDSVAATTTVSSATTTVETQQEAAIAKVEPGVVEIEVTTASGQQIGSGVIIDTKGDIITNNHVVSGEQSIVVALKNGSTEQAQLIGTNASDDLAVVHITPFANMTVVQIGDSSKLVVGQDVLAIGNPLGITETATRGIVSALNRSIAESTSVTLTNAVQTDAALNPGNSGGALINLQGQLIGIPTLGAVNTESNTAANGISFAIPSSTVQTVVQQILQQGN